MKKSLSRVFDDSGCIFNEGITFTILPRKMNSNNTFIFIIYIMVWSEYGGNYYATRIYNAICSVYEIILRKYFVKSP